MNAPAKTRVAKEPAAPNVVELHEIAAAKERERKRHPRVALNFQEPKPRHVLLSARTRITRGGSAITGRTGDHLSGVHGG